jgi:hypothetical protein
MWSYLFIVHKLENGWPRLLEASYESVYLHVNQVIWNNFPNGLIVNAQYLGSSCYIPEKTNQLPFLVDHFC